MKMKYTGERLVTTIKEYWAIEHIHRYALCFGYIKDKIVLDIACGEGYGSNLMSSHAKMVYGVDISNTTISHAAQRYNQSNIEFKHGSATEIPLPDNSVDVVVSFETIEHHDEHEKMLSEIKRILTPAGILLISCPDKLNYSDIPKYKNPFHKKELYKKEFNSLIDSYFKHSVHLSQRTFFGSVITIDDHMSFEPQLFEFSGDFEKVDRSNHAKKPMFNLVLASDNPLDKENVYNSLFESQYEPTIYADIKKHVKKLIKKFKA